LKPGDLINVTAGYQNKKVTHDTMSDKDCLAKLIPFASKMPQKIMNQQN